MSKETRITEGRLRPSLPAPDAALGRDGLKQGPWRRIAAITRLRGSGAIYRERGK